jgi:hypothetical protein
MNDSRAWFPESHSKLGSSRGKKVVDLCDDVLGPGQILGSFNLGLDQMDAVDDGANSNLGKTAGDDMQHCHLGCHILKKEGVYFKV